MLSYQPPSEEVLQGLSQLVQHVHARVSPPPAHAAGRGGAGGGRPAVQPAQAGAAWLVETPIRTVTPPLAGLRVGAAGGGGAGGAGAGVAATALLGPPACAAVQAVSRKVYRLLR